MASPIRTGRVAPQLLAIVFFTACAGCGGTAPSKSLDEKIAECEQDRARLVAQYAEAGVGARLEELEFYRLCRKHKFAPAELLAALPENPKEGDPLFSLSQVRQRWLSWEKDRRELSVQKQRLDARINRLQTAKVRHRVAGHGQKLSAEEQRKRDLEDAEIDVPPGPGPVVDISREDAQRMLIARAKEYTSQTGFQRVSEPPPPPPKLEPQGLDEDAQILITRLTNPGVASSIPAVAGRAAETAKTDLEQAYLELAEGASDAVDKIGKFHAQNGAWKATLLKTLNEYADGLRRAVAVPYEEAFKRALGGEAWGLALSILEDLNVRLPGHSSVIQMSRKLRTQLTSEDDLTRREWNRRLDRIVYPRTGGTSSDGALVNSIGMRMVLIPAGEFWMGSPDGLLQGDEDAEGDEKPQHKVRITQPFFLGMTEVTRGQFRRFVEETGSSANDWRNPGFEQTDDDPVVDVSWSDAVAFAEWLSKKEGMTYGLPTEAQWEYACRAGSTTRYSFGDDPGQLGEYAWFGGNSANRTHPVGRKNPNPWGLFDMHGNVWEWCSDGYAADYYKQSPADDPLGAAGAALRVFRGGSWRDYPRYCRSAIRLRYAPGLRSSGAGFRLARVQSPR